MHPPIAPKHPHSLEAHGHVRDDPYFWLRRRESPEVIAHLEAENAYTEASTAHLRSFEKRLFDEIVGRIQPTDVSVPYRRDDYYYYTRFEESSEYPIYGRRRESLDNPEEILLDVNVLAEGEKFFAVRAMSVSSGQDLLAFSFDNAGHRVCTLRIKDLGSGELLDEVIPETLGGLAWANDNRTLFYVKPEPETLRPHRIYRHVLGTDPAEDVLVYEEADPTFAVHVGKTKSKQYLMIVSSQTLATEYRLIDADDPFAEPRVFLPRERDHEYGVDHFGEHFYIRTNHQARNFRLMRTPIEQTDREHWEEVLGHRDDVLLEDFEIFRDYLVIEERTEGLIQLRVRPWSGEAEHYLDFGEPTYLAYIGTNPELETELLRYGYTSLTTPNSVYDYNLRTREKILRKEQEVLGGFDRSNYRTERVWAEAEDGERVPISVVQHKDTPLDGSAPLLLYGYGSYGHSLDASFSAARLSLLDRGFVYAIAHVRGGEELGRRWYEGGKLLQKKNTFTDFISCAEHLKGIRYGDPRRLYAVGGSAGGLLVGAVINLRGDLFHGAVAMVPFVDVVSTMLDDSIPLTTGEYDEWGNPNDAEYYEYMLSYSPYDNVEAKEYPHLLVMTSLNDSQVQYWEPAKWVAKLRELKTDDHRLLLRTNMEAGHSGTSGRFQQFRETAFYFSVLLDLAGLADAAES